MYANLNLKIGPEENPSNVDVSVFCGWETASSQIRICIVLSAIYTAFLAYRSIMNESKALADRFLNSSQLFVFLLSITGLFDFLSTYDSIGDNYGLCVDTDKLDYKIHSSLISFTINCSTNQFNILGLLMIGCAAAIYYVSQEMKTFRNYISIDSL